MPWSTLIDMPEDQQRAFWKELLVSWKGNAERKADADLAFDNSEELRAWLDIGGRK